MVSSTKKDDKAGPCFALEWAVPYFWSYVPFLVKPCQVFFPFKLLLGRPLGRMKGPYKQGHYTLLKVLSPVPRIVSSSQNIFDKQMDLSNGLPRRLTFLYV